LNKQNILYLYGIILQVCIPSLHDYLLSLSLFLLSNKCITFSAWWCIRLLGSPTRTDFDYLKRLRRCALGRYFACYATLISCLIVSSDENNSLYLSVYSVRHNPRHFTILICHIRGNFTLYCTTYTATRRKFYT